MTDEELEAFLASVRRTRFIDYLDPLGETAQAAFDRRLSWARVSQHDPAYADEASFLLENEPALRRVLTEELDSDDWVEVADSGFNYGRGGGPSGWVKEDGASNEVFSAVEITDEQPLPDFSAPTAPATPTREVSPDAATPRPYPRRPGLRSATIVPGDDDDDRQWDGDPTRTGIMQMEDITEPPTTPRTSKPPEAAPQDTPPRSATPMLGGLYRAAGPVREDEESEDSDPLYKDEYATAPASVVRRHKPSLPPVPPPKLNTPAPTPPPAPRVSRGPAIEAATEKVDKREKAPAVLPPPVAAAPESSGPSPLVLVGIGAMVVFGLAAGVGVWGSGMLSSEPSAAATPPAAPAPRSPRISRSRRRRECGNPPCWDGTTRPFRWCWSIHYRWRSTYPTSRSCPSTRFHRTGTARLPS